MTNTTPRRRYTTQVLLAWRHLDTEETVEQHYTYVTDTPHTSSVALREAVGAGTDAADLAGGYWRCVSATWIATGVTNG